MFKPLPLLPTPTLGFDLGLSSSLGLGMSAKLSTAPVIGLGSGLHPSSGLLESTC